MVVGFGLVMLVAKIWFALFYLQDAEYRKQVSSIYCFASTVMMFGSPLVSAVRYNEYSQYILAYLSRIHYWVCLLGDEHLNHLKVTNIFTCRRETIFAKNC